MRIGILTQPLRSNYGGILQNWALQQVLRRLGHDPVTICYGQYTRRERASMYMRWLAHQVLHTSGRKNVYKAGKDDYKFAALADFCRKNIAVTPGKLACTERNWNNDGCDAYIVGSDQVWRPCYNREPGQFEAMFGAYLPGDKPVVAYAASLGADKWELTPEQTAAAASEIKRFAAISVRERDAVDLLKENLGVDSLPVLDPTLLLEAADYKALIPAEATRRRTLAAYILDRSPEKIARAKEIAARLGLELRMAGLSDENGILPSIESWLATISEADYVVTDSVHGMVFSIIFHRPFTVLMNERRGSSRFATLLDNLGLTGRLSADAHMQPVDWAAVDARLSALRTTSISFLTDNLK